MHKTHGASTIAQWLRDFSGALSHEDLSPVTVRGYLSDLGMFVAWLTQSRGDKLRLNRLTKSDLINYREHLIAAKALKPATVNRRLEALRRFCAWARSQKLIKTDVAHELKAIRMMRGYSPVGLVEPEVHMLLRAAGQSGHGLAKRNYALIQLMLQTGLRVGEVAALSITDVQIRGRSGVVRIRQGKEREVPLNATARRALGLYVESHRRMGDADPFFTSARGNRLSTRTIQAVITELARRAKISRVKVSSHTLRHTFALNYLRQNPGKLADLASLLGHGALDSTAIYTRPSREKLAADLEPNSL
ncbi:MAG TPA: tyrosine-type recombinase/integrase [Terrimicrobiaceae bacterium]